MLPNPIFFAAAYDNGKMTGQAFWLLAIGWGVLKCIEISKRPGTNAKCAIGLMLLLLSWGASSALGLVAKDLPAEVTLISSGMAVVVVFIAMLLAVIGLLEIFKAPSNFDQGTKQGVWTLILSVVYLCLVGSAVLVSSRLRDSQFASSLRQNSIEPGPGAEHVDAELNFRFVRPTREWVPTDPKKMSTDAKLFYTRARPHVYFSIIAERGSTELFTGNDQVVEIAQANLKSVSDAVIGPNEKHLVNGLEGVRFYTDARIKGFDLTYGHWICVKNGYAYQLVGWAAKKEKLEMQQQFNSMLTNFNLVDLNTVAENNAPPLAPFVSEHFGYKANLKLGGWTNSEETRKSINADFCAMRGRDQVAAMITVRLFNEDVPDDAVCIALLKQLEIDFKQVTDMQPYTLPTLKGYVFKFSRTVEAVDYEYHFSFGRHQDSAYLAAVWARRDDPKRKEVFNELRSFVTIPVDKPIDIKSWSPEQRRNQSIILNSLALELGQRQQHDKQIAVQKRAIELSPDEPIQLSNLVYAYEQANQKQLALDTLKDGIKRFPKKRDFWSRMGNLHRGLGNIDDASAAYAKFFDGGHTDAEQFNAYIDFLEEQQRYDQALDFITEYEKRAKSVAVALRRAYIYRSQAKHKESIELLQQWRTTIPYNADLECEIVEAALASEQLGLADSGLKGLFDKKFDTGYLWQLKGRVALAHKSYRDAKTAFEAAVKKEPNNTVSQFYLKRASAHLGQGDNTDVKTVIAPIAIPDELIKPGTLPPGGPRSRADYTSRVWAFSFEKGKELKTTDYWQARINDKSAINAFSTLELGFEPLSEQIFVNFVKVYDADRNLISTGNVDDFYVLDEAYGINTSNKKTLHIPVSGLKPGCIVELMVTRLDHGKPTAMRWNTQSFFSSYACAKSAVYLRGDIDKVKRNASPELKELKLADGVAWSMGPQNEFHFESLMDDYASFTPQVDFADVNATWESETKEYQATIAGMLPPEKEAAALAKQLTAAAKTQDEKISLLLRHLQTDYTYKAIEFGRRARIPAKAALTCTNRYGDCKDHSLLLAQMLKSLDIPANLTLVSSGSKLREDLPSFDKFNHMIVSVPGPDRIRFYDCTDKSSDLSDGIPSSLAGEKVLILESEGPRIVTVPERRKTFVDVAINRNISIENERTAVVVEEVTLAGDTAASFRAHLKDIAPDRLKQVGQNMTGDLRAGLILDSIELLEAEHVDRPFVMKFTYRIQNAFTRIESAIVGRLPSIWEVHFLNAPRVEKRETPFRFKSPFNIECKSHINGPAGYSVREAPVDRPIENKFYKGKLMFKAQRGGLSTIYSLRRPANRFAASEYKEYSEASDSVVNEMEPTITFKKD